MQNITNFFLFVFFLLGSSVAGNADMGELFGYRLGNVYKSDVPISGEVDHAYVDLELTESAKKIGLDSLQAVVEGKKYRAHTLIGIKKFKSWDLAKQYASDLGQLFLEDYGGDYWEVLDAEQEPKNDNYPKHIPRVSIVYEQKFDDTYELVVTLFHGDRIFSQELSDPYIEVRYQNLDVELLGNIYLGSGDE